MDGHKQENIWEFEEGRVESFVGRFSASLRASVSSELVHSRLFIMIRKLLVV